MKSDTLRVIVFAASIVELAKPLLCCFQAIVRLPPIPLVNPTSNNDWP